MPEPSDLLGLPMHANTPFHVAPPGDGSLADVVKRGRSDRLLPALDDIPSHEGDEFSRGTVRWLIAARGSDMVVLMASEILYFQADLKYTRVVWHDGSALIRKGIGQLEKLMDPRSFLRIHRSTLVNIHHVRGIKRDELGRLHVTIRDHEDTLSVSKPFERFFRPL
jgi:DNA-binding LytR/AlgR family response regulator